MSNWYNIKKIHVMKKKIILTIILCALLSSLVVYQIYKTAKEIDSIEMQMINK